MRKGRAFAAGSYPSPPTTWMRAGASAPTVVAATVYPAVAICLSRAVASLSPPLSTYMLEIRGVQALPGASVRTVNGPWL